MTSLRVLSYNIHKGMTTLSGRETIGEIRQSIRSVSADLVFLQEVRGSHKENGAEIDKPAQFEFLADQVWSHYSYGKNAITEIGDHGNAILSKFPIRENLNTDVSAHRFEKRGILFARIDLLPENRSIDCFCLHFGLTARGRDRQLERLTEKVQQISGSDQPLIIAGDFNDWGRKACAVLERSLAVNEAHFAVHKSYARSFPSQIPLLSLDRIYTRGFKVESAEVLRGAQWQTLSDHAPLLTEITLLE